MSPTIDAHGRCDAPVCEVCKPTSGIKSMAEVETAKADRLAALKAACAALGDGRSIYDVVVAAEFLMTGRQPDVIDDDADSVEYTVLDQTAQVEYLVTVYPDSVVTLARRGRFETRFGPALTLRRVES